MLSTNHEKNPVVVAVILARLTSARLPGKGLKDICGRPMLGHVVDRLLQVKCIDHIVLATTNRQEDIPLKAFAEKENILFFAFDGDPEDVVGRISAAAEYCGADILIQISGDCPLIHPPVIQKLVQALLKAKASTAVIAANKGKEVIHEGFDVYSLEGWRKVDKNSVEPHQRENLKACLVDYPDLLDKVYITDEPIFYTLKHRISVDTQADLNFMREIYRRLYKKKDIVDLSEVINLLIEEPSLLKINASVRQKGFHDKSKRIIIRIDTNPKIDGERLASCLDVAARLTQEYFCGVSFVVDEKLREIINESGFGVILLQEQNSIECEIDSLIDYIKEYKADACLVYLRHELLRSYLERLGCLKIPVIDLYNNFKFPELIKMLYL